MTSPAVELEAALWGREISDPCEITLSLDLDNLDAFEDARQSNARSRSDLAIRVAAVRAQLAPINSQSALLDSYRREALCLLTPTNGPLGAAAEALEIAYALRWLELGEPRRTEAARP